MIPIVVVCHNNWKYVENTLKQIEQINPQLCIHILDTASDEEATQQFLKQQEDKRKVFYEPNTGPWITQHCHGSVYDQLPEEFCLTDPDLQFHEDLPSDFVERMSLIANKHNSCKVGFALELPCEACMIPGPYTHDGLTISEYESRFWTTRIADDDYELYDAAVDTTFCLIRKCVPFSWTNCIRIADNFTAKHLPWYKQNPVYAPWENYNMYNQQNKSISTAAKILLNYLESEFLTLRKNQETFLIQKDPKDPNFSFWTNIYARWEPESFAVFDRHVKSDQICVDLGGWIGTTCMYLARKCKHVFVVEPDVVALPYLRRNCRINAVQNVTIFDRPISKDDGAVVTFGKNLFRSDSRMGDSSAQIYASQENKEENKEDSQTMQMTTMSVQGLVDQMNVQEKMNASEICLVKVDIEGGEEDILSDLFRLFPKSVLYISFHYAWWQNKDLTRFEVLDESHIKLIQADPFISMCFLPK